MAELLTFLILMSAGLFLSEIFSRFNLPYMTALIIAGMVVGPFGLQLLVIDSTVGFLGLIGLVFLMFMAGLGMRLPQLRKMDTKIVKIVVFNLAIPFTAGFIIAHLFGYGLISSLLLGIIFISSSMAIAIPSLEACGMLRSAVGQSTVASIVVVDVLSLVFLSLVLQNIAPTTEIPLLAFYVLIFTSLIGLKVLMPKLRELVFTKKKTEKYLYEQELRLIFVMLVSVVVLFEILGLHPIIAGFFTGLALSDSIKSKTLKSKLHAISYGVFIPAFFIIIGSEMDLGAFISVGDTLALTAIVVAGSIFSKFLSGWLGGVFAGFTKEESALVGAAMIPQLSTTLAVAFVGYELALIDAPFMNALIVLSVITAFLGPFLTSTIAKAIENGGVVRR